MQRFAIRDAFNCGDRTALRFRSEYEARRHETIVHDDRTGAAVTGATAFLRARESKSVADCTQQGFVRRAEKLRGLAVDQGLDMQFGHDHRSFARAAAMAATRFVSTPTTVRR